MKELFLVSQDYIDFEVPARILSYQKGSVLNRKCLIVDIDRDIDFKEFGIKKPISRFILLDRFYKNNRIYDLTEFPIEVHVFIPIDFNNPLIGFKKWTELFNTAWAKIVDSNTLNE